MEVPAVDDPRVQCRIPVPVKGRKPVELVLPRFDFIGEEVYDEMMAAAEAVPKDHPDAAQRKINRLVNLAMLKPLLPAKDYAAVQTLAAGQLDAIMLIWAEKSTISLGELLASAPSSTATTGALSNTTSTSEDTAAETSDAA